MTCMDFTPTSNPDYCSSINMGFNCTSDAWDKLYVSGHGAFQPRCTNATTYEQPLPTIPPAEATCDYDVEALRKAHGFTHMRTLKKDQTYLLWKKTTPSFCKQCKPLLEGALVQRSKVGWLAIGIPNEGGGKKGMQGAHVLLGIVSEHDTVLRIKEYEIHHKLTPFDTWTLLEDSVVEASMEVTECGGALFFKTSQLGSWDLNLTVTNSENALLFAADIFTQGIKTTFRNTEYINYHGNPFAEPSGVRGAFTLDFNDKELMLTGGEEETATASVSPIEIASLVIGIVALMIALGTVGFVFFGKDQSNKLSPSEPKDAVLTTAVAPSVAKSTVSKESNIDNHTKNDSNSSNEHSNDSDDVSPVESGPPTV
eukprot:gb/GEZN01008560.1/.p1 GENE.gb/GEZN01008560.1/~~gb/GEZN01008560.1/.p1  ORF type:complete len:426 (+),score=58.71 gb/GEZN01008560.1/:173-1279(+)